MDLVIDANVFFAILIKEGVNYQILFREDLHLFAPEFLFTEFEEHKEEVLEKTKRTREEFFKLVEIIKSRIILIPLEELIEYVPKAEKISPDPDDMAYFAAALKMHCWIWSNDKKMKNQKKVEIISTSELLRM